MAALSPAVLVITKHPEGKAAAVSIAAQVKVVTMKHEKSVVSWTSCPAETVAGQGERRQVLRAVFLD